MDARQIFEKLREEFKEDIIDIVEDKNSDTFIKIKPERIAEVCFYLRDEKDLNFDYMVNLTGMDYGKLLTVVYHLYSINLKHRIVLKVELDKESPNVPSVEMVWKTANWHEREAFDMYGIIFEDHPFLVRILNPYDWEGYPLRKDYKTPEYYHGIRVPY